MALMCSAACGADLIAPEIAGTILREAQALATPLGQSDSQASSGGRLVAVLVWEGKERAGIDVTASFAALARAARIPVRSVLTAAAMGTLRPSGLNSSGEAS